MRVLSTFAASASEKAQKLENKVPHIRAIFLGWLRW
jgi:hypothetical protein